MAEPQHVFRSLNITQAAMHNHEHGHACEMRASAAATTCAAEAESHVVL